MAGVKDLIAWLRSLPLWLRSWRIVGRVDAGDEVPDCLPEKGVVIVGAPGHPTWVALDCPCRAGHRLMVNLDKTRRPFWNVDSVKPLTIWPSIDNITSERRCHFIIRGGRVHWANRNRSVTA